VRERKREKERGRERERKRERERREGGKTRDEKRLFFPFLFPLSAPHSTAVPSSPPFLLMIQIKRQRVKTQWGNK
jgi:hypothetical protein